MCEYNEPTQELIDTAVSNFKAIVMHLKGSDSMSLAFVKNDIIRGMITDYHLNVLPAMLRTGFKAPTTNEMFGVNITIRECPDIE